MQGLKNGIEDTGILISLFNKTKTRWQSLPALPIS